MALWLLARGADCHARDKHNCLPLHYAAASGSLHLTQALAWRMLSDLTLGDASGSGSGSSGSEGGSGGGKGPLAGLTSFASVCAISPDLDLAQMVTPSLIACFFYKYINK